MTTVLRTTVRLDETDAEFLAMLRRPGAAESDAFAALTGKDPERSPAGTLVNALVEAGMQAVLARAEEIRYARLAEHLAGDAEHQAWRESRSSRNAVRGWGEA
jgi:Trk K+ transport system NAD-binding subunit